VLWAEEEEPGQLSRFAEEEEIVPAVRIQVARERNPD